MTVFVSCSSLLLTPHLDMSKRHNWHTVGQQNCRLKQQQSSGGAESGYMQALAS